MATDRVKKIRGTRSKLGVLIRRAYAEARDSDCEPLTFGDLFVGEKFIAMPLPGDNSGHGGLLSGGYLFIKISMETDDSSSHVNNAIDLSGERQLSFDNNMLVYAVL